MLRSFSRLPLTFLLLAALAGTDLYLRRTFFAGIPTSFLGFYALSFLLEGLGLYFVARLVANKRIGNLLLGGISVFYSFAFVASWRFFLYFDTLPGIFAFSYLFEEPGDFLNISASETGFGTVAAYFALGAVIFGALKLDGRLIRTPRLTLRARLLWGLVAFGLFMGMRNGVELGSGPALPLSDAVVSFKEAALLHLTGREYFVRLQRRLVEVPAPIGRDAPFNCILIVNESLNRRNLSAFGYARETTPLLRAFLDRRRGEVYDFPFAFSNATMTTASVPALFTGKLPVEPIEAAQRSTTVYEELSRLGNLKKAVLSSHSYRTGNFYEFLSSKALDRFSFRESMDRPTFNNVGADDRFIAGDLREFLGTLQPGERFFAVLHLNGTHHPYNVPKGEERFGADSPLARYDNSVSYLDRNMAAILKVVEEAGREGETALVFTADHGEELEIPGQMGHLTASTPRTTMVPLFMVIPPKVLDPGSKEALALRANGREPVQNGDIIPTLLDLYGLSGYASKYLGSSLLKPLNQERPLFIYSGFQKAGQGRQLSVVTGGRFVRLTRDEAGAVTGSLEQVEGLAPAGPFTDRERANLDAELSKFQTTSNFKGFGRLQ